MGRKNERYTRYDIRKVVTGLLVNYNNSQTKPENTKNTTLLYANALLNAYFSKTNFSYQLIDLPSNSVIYTHH